MRNRAFPEIKKHLGFGMMRLPMKEIAVEGSDKPERKIDNAIVCDMVDRFIEKGFNYFDTAHGYHDGLSEIAVGECLTSRYDRSAYILTDKLTDEYFKSESDIVPLFEEQLKACGVEYLDFYLMHAQNARNFKFFKECRAYETAFSLKEQGRIRHVGLSFHDKAEVLDQILTEYPQIEIVQIQFNYLDYENENVEGRKVYEVCRKHNKPVLVMEPVKGGNLVRLPKEAAAVFDDLRSETGLDCSDAGYALRFAAGFDGMEVVLSGMSSFEQMEDNLKTFTQEDGDIMPLSQREMDAIKSVTEIFASKGAVPCTACRYCIEENHCPMDIRIPGVFSAYNRKLLFDDPDAQEDYFEFYTKNHGKASDCIKCGMCENVCPQHLEIRDLLEKIAEVFE